MEIKFGTAGWRGIFADDFTFARVKIVVQAICDLLVENNMTDNGIFVCNDSRFMGEKFSELAISILSANGIKVFYTDRETPVPVASYEVITRNLDGAINFTASSNSAEYNGIKFTNSSGSPALPETTREIENKIQAIIGSSRQVKEIRNNKFCNFIDPKTSYFEKLRSMIDFELIRDSRVKIIFDPLYGTGRGYLNQLLIEEGINVKTLHNFRDSYFGGNAPKPSEENLLEMAEEIKESDSMTIGLALDSDGDSFGIIDVNGEFIQPNYILALLFNYLCEKNKELKNLSVARSVATTTLIDRIAALNGIKVIETPIGFKYIGELISKNKVIMGGESSGGFSLYGHIPEKDGILACLLVLEMVSFYRKPLHVILDDIYKKTGKVVNKTLNLTMDEKKVESLKKRLLKPPTTFFNKKIMNLITLDGNKFLLEDKSSVLFRQSGTENYFRVYIEASDDEALEKLIQHTTLFANGEL